MFKTVTCLVHANLLFAIDIDCNLLPRIAYKSLCIANTIRRVYMHYVTCTYVHIYIYIFRKKRKKKDTYQEWRDSYRKRCREKGREREREKMYPSKQLDPGSCPFLVSTIRSFVVPLIDTYSSSQFLRTVFSATSDLILITLFVTLLLLSLYIYFFIY